MSYQEFPIGVRGGTLKLCATFADEPDAPPVQRLHSLSFEYAGALPGEMAMELVRQTPECADGSMLVNGMTVLEYLEGLGADPGQR